MEPFLAILHKYRPSHFPRGVTGWNGCRCGCHGPRCVVMHFRACCHPSYEDFEAIRDLYRENGPASEEIQKILDEILNGIMSSPLGFLALYDIYSGKAPAEPRRARKRLQVFSELPPAEYRRAIVQGK